MGNLLIRDVDDAVVRRLKTKAEINGTTLQHEASVALERGAPMTGADRKALFDKIEAERGFPKVEICSVELVRAVRDEAETWDLDHS